MNNIIIFQGVFYPLPSYETFTQNVTEEVKSSIDMEILHKFEQNLIEKNDLNFVSQIVHALNVSKFQRYNKKTDYYSGFSVGIYAALYASNHISLKDSFSLVKKRALILKENISNNWSLYTISGMKLEKIQELKQTFKDKLFISTVSSNRHFSIAINTNFFDEIAKNLKEIGYFNFEKLSDNAAWHTKALEKAKDELYLLYGNYTFSENKNKLIFSQNTSNTNLKELLLEDNFNYVNFPNLISFVTKNNLSPVFFDETDSLEKIWYSNTKNKNYEVVKCVPFQE